MKCNYLDIHVDSNLYMLLMMNLRKKYMHLLSPPLVPGFAVAREIYSLV